MFVRYFFLNGSLNSKFQIINPDGITKNFYYKKVLVRQVDGLDFLKLLIFRKQGHKEHLINILMSQLVKFLIMD